MFLKKLISCTIELLWSFFLICKINFQWKVIENVELLAIKKEKDLKTPLLILLPHIYYHFMFMLSCAFYSILLSPWFFLFFVVFLNRENLIKLWNETENSISQSNKMNRLEYYLYKGIIKAFGFYIYESLNQYCFSVYIFLSIYTYIHIVQSSSFLTEKRHNIMWTKNNLILLFS